MTNKITTSCKDCKFAQYDEKGFTQISCRAGVLDKVEYQEAYDEEKEFNIIEDFFCQYKRTEGDPSLEQVKKEIYPLVEVLVKFSSVENMARIYQEIERFAEFIDGAGVKPISRVVCLLEEKDKVYGRELLELSTSKPFRYRHTYLLEDKQMDNEEYYYYAKTTDDRAGWLYLTDDKTNFRGDLIQKLDSEMNGSLRTIMVVRDSLSSSMLINKPILLHVGGYEFIREIPEKLCLTI